MSVLLSPVQLMVTKPSSTLSYRELPPDKIVTDHALPSQQNYLEHKLCCEVTSEGQLT